MKAKNSKKAPWRPWGDHPWFVALSALAAVATLLGVIVTLWAPREPEVRPTAQPESAAQPPDGQVRIHSPDLPEEVVRGLITTALADGRVEAAVELVKRLPEGSAKADECERVFSFCIKNPIVDDALNRATAVARECWNGTRRQDALEQIELTRLKAR